MLHRPTHYLLSLVTVVCLWAMPALSQSRYIGDLRILFDDEATPAGFVKIPTDLNKGAKGKFIYLCYRETTNPDEAIRGLKILVGEKATAPSSYTKLGRDLNAGAKGEYVFLASSKERSAGSAIQQIKFDVSERSLQDRRTLDKAKGGLALGGNPNVSAFSYLETDLNKGAGGSFIYLMYR